MAGTFCSVQTGRIRSVRWRWRGTRRGTRCEDRWRWAPTRGRRRRWELIWGSRSVPAMIARWRFRMNRCYECCQRALQYVLSHVHAARTRPTYWDYARRPFALLLSLSAQGGYRRHLLNDIVLSQARWPWSDVTMRCSKASLHPRLGQYSRTCWFANFRTTLMLADSLTKIVTRSIS